MAHFSLLSVWRVRAPIEPVWNTLHDTAAWPAWWRYVVSVTALAPGLVHDVGSRWRLAWRTALGYRLTFEAYVTHVHAPHELDAEVRGEIDGIGRWRLTETDGVTEARYRWDVTASKPWMRALAPLLAPVFRWNHARVMDEGARGLARRLHADLLHTENRPLMRSPVIAIDL